MRSLRSPRVLLATLALTLGACASAAPDAAYERMRRDITDRGGPGSEILPHAPTSEIESVTREILSVPLTDRDAVRLAILNNQRLRSAYARLGVAAAEVAQASRLQNPLVEATALLDGGEVSVLELSVLGELLDGILIPLRRQIAGDELALTELEVTREVLQTVNATRTAYYAVVSDLQALELWRSVLLSAEASYEMSESLFTAGNVSRLTLLRERDLLEQTRLEVARVELDLLDGRERLNRLMGLWGPAANEWTVAERLPDPPSEEIDLGTLESRAVAASLDLRIAEKEIEAAARRFGLERLDVVLPEAEIGVVAERETEDGEKEWAVGPSLSLALPIFDLGGPTRARARTELQGLWSELTADAVEIRSSTRSTALRLRLSRQRFEYVRDVVLPLRRQITEEAQLHYNAMFVGVFELLDAKRREIEAGREFVRALEDYWTTRVAVDGILMGLSPAGMADGAIGADLPTLGLTREGAERGGH